MDFIEVLRKDAGNLTTTELRTVMEDRTAWRNHTTAHFIGPCHCSVSAQFVSMLV